jgi:transposase
MIHLPASVRVYLCLTACDMRKSFDGLHALVREHLELDAFAGHLFVFASRRRDRVKILYWGVSRMQVKTCGAVPKMGEGLPESTFRSWLQTTRSCCVQKAWW